MRRVGGMSGCGMKLGALEGSHTAEKERADKRTAQAASHTSQTHRDGPEKKGEGRGGAGGEEEQEEGASAQHGHVRTRLPASERRGAGLHPGL